MPTVIDAGLHEFHEWIYRFHPATGVPSRLLLLLHGWTGDENSMWVFTRKLPAQVAILAPRGVYIAPEGGYTWREIQPGKKGFPRVEEFRQSAEALVRFVDEWSSSSGVIADQFDLIGFSQGAALAYSLALLHPERIRAMAALSGFMPPGARELLLRRPLAGKPIFVAHGMRIRWSQLSRRARLWHCWMVREHGSPIASLTVVTNSASTVMPDWQNYLVRIVSSLGNPPRLSAMLKIFNK